MEKILKAIQITPHVYWVGAIDWQIRDFHGYATTRGSTYNAYLIVDEKIVLVDAVKKEFKEELLSRIRSVVDPSKIDYIISNHSEPDHTGCLDDIIDIANPEEIFASNMGAKTLKKHFHWDREIKVVKTGDSISLGDVDVSFIETRMLHWPDSMFSYIEKEGVLFSQDAFGLHLASGERFVDECPPEVIYEESENYFANILLPYAPRVAGLIKSVSEMNLNLKVIASDHGPIWRQDLDTPIKWYAKWAEQKPCTKAVIIFDTMWHATENMAMTIAESLIEEGISVKVMPMKGSHRTQVIREILSSGAVIVGSPTLNNNIFPSLADVLTYIKGLKPKNKIGAVFGSYGWSGESIKQTEEYLKATEIDVVDSLRIQYQPDRESLEKCRVLGKNVAKKLKEHVKNFGVEHCED